MAELPIVSDVTYESRWIEMSTILQNGLDEKYGRYSAGNAKRVNI